MDFRMTKDSLKQVQILVGTPMYAMKCHGAYLSSVLSLMQLCHQLGVRIAISTICNESLLQRSRNYIADEFLRSGFTHLLFVDSDIQFRPEYVLALLMMDKDIVGGDYTNKKIDWERLVRSGLPADKLHLLAGDLPTPAKTGDLVETHVLPTGFMLIKRKVLEKIQVAFPEYHYKPDHNFMQCFNGTRYIQMFFNSEMDEDTQELLSEYEFFCRTWRKIGGKIYTCPWMALTHIGMHKY